MLAVEVERFAYHSKIAKRNWLDQRCLSLLGLNARGTKAVHLAPV